MTDRRWYFCRSGGAITDAIYGPPGGHYSVRSQPPGMGTIDTLDWLDGMVILLLLSRF